VALGQALRGIASACIDVSDGLAGDLGHVLAASGAGATLQAEAASNLLATRQNQIKGYAPFDPQNTAFARLPGGLAQRLHCALYGGDDYELAFTAPPAQRAAVLRAAQAAGVPVTRLGRIDAEPGLRLTLPDGAFMALAARGFDHFGSSSIAA
jgi:thiamine-monophosphate kinase